MATTFSRTVLMSLTAAALATPGLAQATSPNRATSPLATPAAGGQQQSGSDKSWYQNIKTDLRFTRYTEDGPRYDINVWQAHFVIPRDQWTFTVDAQRDSQTGTSQYYSTIAAFFDPTLPPLQPFSLRSGASIVEKGNELKVKGSYKLPESKYEVSAYYWGENDLVAPGLSLLGEWDFNKHNTIVNAGLGATYFRSNPSDIADLSTLRRTKGQYWIQKYFVSLRQDLSKYNFVLLSTEFQYQSGDLKEPYKYVDIAGDASAYGTGPGTSYFLPGAFTAPIFPDGVTILYDRRPKTRSIWMPMVRFVQYVPGADGTLHFDYRFGADSWDLRSHTFELKYFQTFLSDWQIAPVVRYYSQSQVDFYGPTYNMGPGTPMVQTVPFTTKGSTSDYRLSAYGTVNVEVRLGYQALKFLNTGLTAGYYRLKPTWTMSSMSLPNLALPKKGFGAHYFGLDMRLKL